MDAAPKSRADWLRAYFIGLEVLCISSTLPGFRGAYGDWVLSDHGGSLIGPIALSSIGLLLLSSIVVVFFRWKLAVSGFLVIALLICGMILFPQARVN